MYIYKGIHIHKFAGPSSLGVLDLWQSPLTPYFLLQLTPLPQWILGSKVLTQISSIASFGRP